MTTDSKVEQFRVPTCGEDCPCRRKQESMEEKIENLRSRVLHMELLLGVLDDD